MTPHLLLLGTGRGGAFPRTPGVFGQPRLSRIHIIGSPGLYINSSAGGTAKHLLKITSDFLQEFSRFQGLSSAPLPWFQARRKGVSSSVTGLIFGMYQLMAFISSPVFGTFVSWHTIFCYNHEISMWGYILAAMNKPINFLEIH